MLACQRRALHRGGRCLARLVHRPGRLRPRTQSLTPPQSRRPTPGASRTRRPRRCQLRERTPCRRHAAPSAWLCCCSAAPTSPPRCAQRRCPISPPLCTTCSARSTTPTPPACCTAARYSAHNDASSCLMASCHHWAWRVLARPIHVNLCICHSFFWSHLLGQGRQSALKDAVQNAALLEIWIQIPRNHL